MRPISKIPNTKKGKPWVQTPVPHTKGGRAVSMFFKLFWSVSSEQIYLKKSGVVSQKKGITTELQWVTGPASNCGWLQILSMCPHQHGTPVGVGVHWTIPEGKEAHRQMAAFPLGRKEEVFFFLFFFGGTRFEFRASCLQTRCSIAWATALFYSGYFGNGVLRTIFPGWLSTAVLLISASQVARITGVSHQHPGQTRGSLDGDPFASALYRTPPFC
jgi:hypothetical protein